MVLEWTGQFLLLRASSIETFNLNTLYREQQVCSSTRVL